MCVKGRVEGFMVSLRHPLIYVADNGLSLKWLLLLTLAKMKWGYFIACIIMLVVISVMFYYCLLL